MYVAIGFRVFSHMVKVSREDEAVQPKITGAD